MLDGEIAVPDERAVTHIEALTEALRQRCSERLAYFAFDLLHLNGHDLRGCPIEDRKTLLRTGYIERGAVAVAKLRDGVLVPAGRVQFRLAGKGICGGVFIGCGAVPQPVPGFTRCTQNWWRRLLFWALPHRLDS